MTLLIVSFVAGVLTILAPCVLPLLPVIIGGSLAADSEKQKSRPFIIAASLAVSIILFTLLLKASTLLIDVSPDVWTYISGGIVIILGLLSVFPNVWEKLAAKLKLQSGSNKMLSKGMQSKGKYVGPILIGAALGPVFSSCSPTYAYILATVLPRNPVEGFFHLVAYSLGLVLVLLLVSIFGQRLIQRFKWAADPHGWFRRGIGILFIIIGLLIFTGVEKKFETWLINNNSFFDITRIEQQIFENSVDEEEGVQGDSTMNKDELLNVTPGVPAPEIQGIESWINSDALTLEELRGKVVLIDFWTYSCINCIRTLPYLQQWHETYKDKGFVLIGVHAPEFAFEQKRENVEEAIAEYGLTYPVAQDNDFATWRAYNNRFWPAHYLIDKEGNVRYTHFGEGEYDTTEAAIQALLGEERTLTVGEVAPSSSRAQTPETYFGVARAENYVGETPLSLGPSTYIPAETFSVNTWTLEGDWSVDEESITSESPNAKLKMTIQAKDVYMVANANGLDSQIGVELQDAPEKWQGLDVVGGMVQLDSSEFYHLVSFDNFGSATLELSVPEGVSLFTFTFGS